MSTRIEQLNSLVQHEVAELLKREIEFPLETFVTISKVKVADDAESAKVWISVLPSDAGPAALEKINQNIRDLQAELNRRLVMKFVPKLTFVLDLTAAKAERVNTVLDSLTSDDLGGPAPTA